MKFQLMLLSFDVIISLLYSIIIHHFSVISFINCFFIIGMFYFLFGALCFVWQGGFFNITLFSFNKIHQLTRKENKLLAEDDVDISLNDYVERKNHFALTNSLLFCGGFISFFSILISFMCL